LLKDLENREVEFGSVGEFLLELRKKFGERDEESVKVAELRRIEQGERNIKEFMQEFQRAVRDNRYEERVLVEEFKREMSGAIRRKLIEAKRPPTSID